MSQSAELNLHLHAKQGEALNTEATEVLYGGAAGGGKSHLMRVAAIIWASMIPGLQVYLFRRIRDDLVKNHMEGPKGFRAMLAPWVAAGLVNIVEDEIRFWNGSKLYLCHCKDEKDIYKYQGAEIHVLIIDELTHFTESMYRFLRNRVRMVGIVLPDMYRGKFPRILCGANPGNVGHLFVKMTFVDGVQPMELRRMPNAEGGMLRQYIPAQLDDNPSMAEDDPGYEGRLEGLGSEQLVRAMRFGDWDVVEGAFFDCWRAERHVIRPFEVNEEWPRFWSGDWGSARPFSFGLWVVLGDRVRTPDGLWLPRGMLLRISEWYGCVPGQPNAGLKLPAEKVGEGLADRGRGIKQTAGVLDPAAFASDGGPSIAERLHQGAKNIGGRLLFRPADNKRVPQKGALGGWDQMRGRMIGDGDGLPMIGCFATCRDSIRTIPTLQHDTSRPEDLDSDGEDHCFAAGTLVETDAGPQPIEALAETGVVLTDRGWRDYRSARLVQKNAELVRLRFSNGREVTCTPDHRFLLDRSDEWRYASDLKGSEVRCVQSSSVRQFKSSTDFATIVAAFTSNARASDFIAECGRPTMGPSQMASMCITGMKIGPTTSPKTSKLFRGESTGPIGMVSHQASAESRRSSGPPAPQRSGTAARSAVSGTPTTTSGTSAPRWTAAFLRSVRSVAAAIWSAQRAWRRGGFAGEPARPVRCVSVERLTERADVYCLTVPSLGRFAIEGGLIVANCADEWRYACMSRPWTPPARELKPKRRDMWADSEDEGSADAWKVA